MNSRHGNRLASTGSKNCTIYSVRTHRDWFLVGSKGKNWKVGSVSIHRGRFTVRSVSNTCNGPPVSDHSLQSCTVGNHRCLGTVSHIGRRQVSDCVCSIPRFTTRGSVSLFFSYLIVVLGDWQVRNTRCRPVRTTGVDAPTGTKVGIS